MEVYESDDYFTDDDNLSDCDTIDDILDEGWMKEFEFIENNYDKFYNVDNEKVKLCSIYINDKEVEKINTQTHNLKNKNQLSKQELQSFINNLSNNNYKLDSILRYNISMRPAELIDFKKKGIELDDKFKYMNKIESIEDIYIMPSIQMFSDLNTIYFFFEKIKKTNRMTKKIIFKNKNEIRGKKNKTKKNI